MNTERAIELIPLSGFKVLRKGESNFLYKIIVNGEEPKKVMKKKAIKIATASVVAASSFAAVAPFSTEAASSVPSTVAKAVKSMKAAKTAYKSLGDKGKVASVASVQKAVNQAKADYSKAKAALAKYKGKDKSKLNKQLMAAMKDYHNATDYIKAVNYASGLKKQADSFAAAAKAGKSINVSDYAKFKAELAKATKKVMDQIVGLADKAVVKAYITPALSAAKTVDSYLVSIKSVDEVAAVTVDEGSKLEDVNLPKEVTVTLVNGKKAQKAVTWDTKELEANLSKPGDYTVKGAVAGTKLEASVKVTVKAVNPKVESVSAINLAEVQVVFSKAVDEDSIDNGDFNIGGTAISASDVTLSEDGKIATIAFSSTNNTSYRVIVDGIKTVDGSDFPKFDQVVTFSDKVAPTLVSTNYVKANDTATLTFSEPLSSLGTVTLTDKNGVSTVVAPTFSLGDSQAVISTAGLADGAYTVTLIGAQDLAGNFFANNKVVTTFVAGSTDTVPPTVTSVKALNSKLVQVTFSEKLFSAGTVAVGAGSPITLTKNSSLASAGDYTVDSTGLVYTINVGSLTNDSFNSLTFAGQKDLSGNTLTTVTKTISFLDTAAPTLVGTKVSGSKVTLSFDEDVVLSGTQTAKFVAPNGVLKTVAASDITYASATNHKDVVVNLSSYVTSVLSGTYSLSFNKNDIADSVGNSVAYTTNFKLSSSADVTPPEVQDADAGSDANLLYNAANGTVTVLYSEAMGASALDLNNYTVDGQKVFKSAYFDGNTNKVVLTLNDGVFSTSALRTVKIENVKDVAGNVLKNGSYTETINFSENVAPKLLSAVASADGTKLTLTFSESLDDATIGAGEGAGAAADFQVLVDGVAQVYTNEVAVAGSSNTKYEITFGTALTPSQLSKVITLKPVNGIDVTDVAGNALTAFTTFTVTR